MLYSIFLSSPLCLLALFVVHIIHVHAMTYLVFTIGILGTSMAVHHITDIRIRTWGRCLPWLFCSWLMNVDLFDNTFRLQIVVM